MGLGKMLSLPTPADSGFEAVIDVLANLCEKVAAEYGGEIQAVGVGAPGIKHAETGLTWAPNLGWEDQPLDQTLSGRIGIPVFSENDANVAAMAEAYAGAGRGHDSMLMLTLGTGIGCGWVRNGHIDRGAHGWSGEAGHMTLILDGKPCNCGRNGCFERYASARALGEQARKAAKEHPRSSLNQKPLEEIDARFLEQCARGGDVVALWVWDQYVEYLAAGISSIVCLLDPGRVVLGGGVSNAGDFLIGPVREKLMRVRLNRVTPVPDVCAAECGGEAGCLGAALSALLALEEQLEN